MTRIKSICITSLICFVTLNPLQAIAYNESVIIERVEDPTTWIPTSQYEQIMDDAIKKDYPELFVEETPAEVQNITSTKTNINYSEKELDILARIISAEVLGEPYEAKLAVGTVVMNRLGNPKFGKTVKDVVFQKNQFAINGSQYNNPDEDCYKAAKEVLEGYRSFNSDVLAFYAHNSIRPGHPMLKWKKHCVIKNTTFCYIP